MTITEISHDFVFLLLLLLPIETITNNLFEYFRIRTLEQMNGKYTNDDKGFCFIML